MLRLYEDVDRDANEDELLVSFWTARGMLRGVVLLHAHKKNPPAFQQQVSYDERLSDYFVSNLPTGATLPSRGLAGIRRAGAETAKGASATERHTWRHGVQLVGGRAVGSDCVMVFSYLYKNKEPVVYYL